MHRHRERRRRYFYEAYGDQLDFPLLEGIGQIAVAASAAASYARSLEGRQLSEEIAIAERFRGLTMSKRQRIADNETCDSGISAANHGSSISSTVAENTGPWSHSNSHISLGRIPRGVYQTIRHEPRWSYVENGALSLGSKVSEVGMQFMEYWAGDNLTYFMTNAYQFFKDIKEYDTTPPLIAIQKTVGYVFDESIEYVLTNQSNVPIRMWIIEYVWKKSGDEMKTFTSGTGESIVPLTIANLWKEGYVLDLNQPSLTTVRPENTYGYTYGRSKPLQQFVHFLRRKEVHMQPGQTHIHSVKWAMNKTLNMEKIAQENNWDTSAFKHGGLTHGTMWIQHGTVGATTGTAAWGLLPTQVGCVWRRTMNMVVRDRLYGATKGAFNLSNTQVPLAQPLINPLEGTKVGIEKTS